MLPLLFIGGAITGALGLTAAALYDSAKTEAQYSPGLKTPNQLDANEVARQLNRYFFQANELGMKCNNIVMEGQDLAVTPLNLPDDNLMQKASDYIFGGLTSIGRTLKEKQVLDLKEDVQKLYKRYLGVFIRANEILQERGQMPLDLKELSFKGIDFKINNSLSNDDWILDFSDLAEKVNTFVERSGAIADQLINMLEDESKALAIEAKESQV